VSRSFSWPAPGLPHPSALPRRDLPHPQFTHPVADIGISTAHNASKIHNPIMTFSILSM